MRLIDALDCVRQLVTNRGQLLTSGKQTHAQTNRWISVEERMPEAHKNVLIHVTTPIGRWNTEIDCMDEQGWVFNADSEQYHITHWMPLPEPPKEE